MTKGKVMNARWHLIKYMSDPRRREPRNVGLALEVEGQWFLRFIGEDERGSINGRKIKGAKLDKEVYATWVAYYRRKASRGSWVDAKNLSEKRPDNFFTEFGGEIFTDASDTGALLERLYQELVEEPKILTPSEIFHQRVKRVFHLAHVAPETKAVVDGKWDPFGEVVPIQFDYGYQNGQYHVMDAVGISRPSSVRDFKARIDAASRVGQVKSYIAFYSPEQVDDERKVDNIIRPIEAGAITINVDDEEAAANDLVDIMGH